MGELIDMLEPRMTPERRASIIQRLADLVDKIELSELQLELYKREQARLRSVLNGEV